MGEAIVELIQVLNSKDEGERMTKQEADVFVDCKNRAIKGFALGGSVATGLAWVASRKLNTFFRVNVAGGAGFIVGMWSLRESINSCVNDILEMKGSRLEHELRKIVVEKYGNNPQRMQPFARHFYKEEVLNDSAPGIPKTVYRHRNLYTEDQQIANRDMYGVSDALKSGMNRQKRNEDPESFKLNRPNVGVRPVRMNSAVNMGGYGDPLEVLFGYSPSEDPQPDNCGISTKAQSRVQKRAHRRHRMRHRHQESLSMEGA